jgi:hypothetical protein
MNIVQAMMATTVQGGAYGASPEGRSGFEVLSALVNSTDISKPEVITATDNLFSAPWFAQTPASPRGSTSSAKARHSTK